MIEANILEILSRARCEGNLLYLPEGQLERKTYERVNEVLSRLGGKWKGGKVMAHVFEEDAAPLLKELLASGEKPPDNPFDFYRTPPAVIERMLGLVPNRLDWEIRKFLEPSAGDGAIVAAIYQSFPMAEIYAIEINPKLLHKILIRENIRTLQCDFLKYDLPFRFDCIVMNPPFATERDKLEYVAHINHALNMLAEGGTLISIAPAGLLTRDDRRTRELRERILNAGGTIEELPDGSFKESGTMVSTVLAHVKI